MNWGSPQKGSSLITEIAKSTGNLIKGASLEQGQSASSGNLIQGTSLEQGQSVSLLVLGGHGKAVSLKFATTFCLV
jgi:hypothetical protein